MTKLSAAFFIFLKLDANFLLEGLYILIIANFKRFRYIPRLLKVIQFVELTL